MVTNMILLERIPKRKAMQLNMQWYDPASLAQWVRSGKRFVPHSRRRLTAAELANLDRRAPPPAPRAPRAPRPPPQDIRAFFRRSNRGGHTQFKYYAASDSEQAYHLTRAGNWGRMPAGRIDARILLERPMRVDVSLDFGPGGQGHWEQVRNGNVAEFRTPRYGPMTRRRENNAFFVALRSMLPPHCSPLWQRHV